MKAQFPNYEVETKNKGKLNKRDKRDKYKKATFHNDINMDGNLNTNPNEDNTLHDDDYDYDDDNYFESNKNNNNKEIDNDPFQDARNILDIMGMKTLIPNNPNSNHGDDIKSSRDNFNYNRDSKYYGDQSVNEKFYDTSTSTGKTSNNIGMEVYHYIHYHNNNFNCTILLVYML